MKISIVTISYNQAEFLEKTILSVVNQKAYVDIEYIIVDPGSTDGSREIIAKYHDVIDHVILEPDEGPSDGLNKGFACATGEVLGFLNSDDVLFPGALISAISHFQDNPDVDVISAHANIIDKNDNVLRKCFSRSVSLRKYAYGVSIIIQPSTFFRRSIFDKTAGFNKENRCNWDGELFIDMALQDAKFLVINEIWSGYRLHDVSITGTAKLDDAMHQYQERMFLKIIGRSRKPSDKYLSTLYTLVHFITHPSELWERLARGRIYGRSTS